MTRDALTLEHRLHREFATRTRKNDGPPRTRLDPRWDLPAWPFSVTAIFSWFDAHLWAYAEHYGLDEIASDGFEHGRLCGSVRIRNPFYRR